MEAPKIPFDETERIEALYSTELLDTPREQLFDNLTKLVSETFDIPIVAISLIDKSRQWFKSIQGLDVCETSRDVSFCGHVADSKIPLIVENAHRDVRFLDNPLVIGDPRIVFYAGIPLRYELKGEEYIIGTLCIIDTKERHLTDKQFEMLKSFAYQVELLINMRLSTDRAESLSEVKSTFLANMSHELRTPIAGVIGILDVLKHSSEDTQQLHHIELARKSSTVLLSVINDILDFSKAEAGKIVINQDVFSLKQLLEDVVEVFTLKESSTTKQFVLSCDFPNDFLVTGDIVRIKQVLFNLLSNADKFTDVGLININALIFNQSEDKVTFQCSISDSGIGIASEQINKLFSPFEQIESGASRRYGGTGLGLSICKKLCQLMGGDIQLSSEVNVGTTVTFSIALGRPEPNAQTESTDKEISIVDELVGALSDIRVLVVEDDSTNRIIIEYFLNKLNLDFDSAQNGFEALDYLNIQQEEAYYDVVIMDCQMPGMDGFEATSHIRSGQCGLTYSTIPIIALTANATGVDQGKCLAAGMSDFMTKPVSLDTLVEKLTIWAAPEHLVNH